MSRYDLIVVGSGPAGRSGAIQAAKLGSRVLVVERGRRVGGVSVHTGTIPSKTLRETILNLSGWRERNFYGRAWRAKADIDTGDLKLRLRKTLEYEVEVLEHQFARNRVETRRGEAKFVSADSIEVVGADRTRMVYTADRFLITTGTRPFRPDYVPFNGRNVIDSDEIIELSFVPGSAIVVGAGVIGVEYATMLQALDIRTTLIEPRKSFLDFIDRTLIAEFTAIIRDMGLDLRLGTGVTAIDASDRSVRVQMDTGRQVRADMLLFAAGRLGATDSLNLKACGIDVDHRGRIEVDRGTFRTCRPNIYAAGDVIGFPCLASTALQQGRVAASHALDGPSIRQSPWFPYGIYSVPEMSTCGMSEEELRERGIGYEVGVARFRETSRGHIMGVDHGFLKILVSLKTRRLLGVQIVGEGATELIHIAQAVLDLKGTVDYFVENTFNYPTLAEAYKIAGLDAWNRMPEPASGDTADAEAGESGDAKT